MRKSGFLVLLFCLLLKSYCPAASQPNHHGHIPMPMTAPLYLENDVYESTLYLVNALDLGMSVDTSVYDMSGALLITKHSYMAPTSQMSLRISTILSDVGIYSEIGSVEVMSPLHSSGLLGQLSVTRKGSATSYLDEELFTPSKLSSNLLRGVLDGSALTTVIAITNTSPINVHNGQLTCVDNSPFPQTSAFTLQPKQTMLVHPCTQTPRNISSPSLIDADLSATRDRPLAPSQQATGVEIHFDGTPGELTSFGFASDDNGLFSSMNFLDPQVLQSANLIFTGFPVGSSTLLPNATYEPRLAVANFSPKSKSVSVVFSSTINGAVHAESLLTVEVPKWSSLNIPLRKPQSADTHWQNAITASSNGVPGEVLTKLVLAGNREQPSVEVMAKDGKNPFTAGHHPWSIQHGMRSVLFLYNHSGKDTTVDVQVGSTSGTWSQLYPLKSNEVFSLSINQLSESHQKDLAGHQIDPTTQQGEISWWAPSPTSPEITGRLVQVNADATEARNFSCQNFTLVCVAHIQTDPLYLLPTHSTSLNGSVTMCQSDDREVCDDNGNYGGSTSQVSYTWSSDNTAVATVNNSNAIAVTWNGIKPGNANADFIALNQRDVSNYCEVSSTVTVQQPTSLPVVRTLNSGQRSNCPAGQAGPMRLVERQLTDQNSQPIVAQGDYITEQLAVGSPNDLNFQSNSITPANATTDAQGQVLDTFGFCSAACPSSSRTTNIIQTLTDTSSGGPWSLGQYTLTMSCPNVKVNGALTP